MTQLLTATDELKTPFGAFTSAKYFSKEGEYDRVFIAYVTLDLLLLNVIPFVESSEDDVIALLENRIPIGLIGIKGQDAVTAPFIKTPQIEEWLETLAKR